jgi:hypothetical protein
MERICAGAIPQPSSETESFQQATSLPALIRMEWMEPRICKRCPRVPRSLSQERAREWEGCACPPQSPDRASASSLRCILCRCECHIHGTRRRDLILSGKSGGIHGPQLPIEPQPPGEFSQPMRTCVTLPYGARATVRMSPPLWRKCRPHGSLGSVRSVVSADTTCRLKSFAEDYLFA